MAIFNFKRREAATLPAIDDEATVDAVEMPNDAYDAPRVGVTNDHPPAREKKKRSSKLGWLLMLVCIASVAMWDHDVTTRHQQAIDKKMNELDALINPAAKEVVELNEKISTLQQSSRTLQDQVAALTQLPTVVDALRETQMATASTVGQMDDRLKRVETAARKRADEQAAAQQRQALAEQQRATEVAAKPEFPNKILGVDNWGGTPLVSMAGPNNAPLLLRAGQSVGEWTVVKIDLATRRVTLRHAGGYVYTTAAN